MTEQSVKPHLFDIQGNILRGYRSLTFARFLYYHISGAEAGRKFIARLIPSITAADWGERRPTSATNIAISHLGLIALGLPARSLASFPAEFQRGMLDRAQALGDIGDSAPKHWDQIWQSRVVHVLVTVYSCNDKEREAQTDEISGIARIVNAEEPAGGLEEVGRQDAQWSIVNETRFEHFGFADGLSNPDVEGVPKNAPHLDIGNPTRAGTFRKVPLGEFILGWAGEGGESAPMPLPHALAQNSSFLVVRKLEQRVGVFRRFLAQQSKVLQRTLGADYPSKRPATEYLAAKMMGRWPDGSAVAAFPDTPKRDPRNGFGYADDPDGARCPLGAHIRRVYPRDSLGFGGKTVNRHRIIRRGIPYGEYLPPEQEEDGKQRGLMFLAYNSGVDQFEFVQTNWIASGEEFEQGDDSDPILGSPQRRMTIPGDPVKLRRPFICFGIPQFVVTRGGDYFFVPSISGLRLIASNTVAV